MAKTKKTKTTNLIIIDASGSMGSKKPEVIGGLKELFKSIRNDAEKDKKKVEVTTIVVDFSGKGDIRTLVNSKDSTELTDSLADKYSTRGMTALYDAIGQGFSMIPKDSDSVFINILTDGEENDSKEITYAMVKNLFNQAEKDKWVVTFMGTTQEAINNATSLGVSLGNTFMFEDNGMGVGETFSKLSSAREAYYNTTKTFSKKSLLSADIKLDNLMQDGSDR